VGRAEGGKMRRLEGKKLRNNSVTSELCGEIIRI
jgi:hypothetical protein